MFQSVILNSTIDFGITVAIVGFLIVIVALTFLFFVFVNLPGIIKFFKNYGQKQSEKRTTRKNSKAQEDEYIEGNVTAAISLALHSYFNELHDDESNIVTIKRVEKAYSPWSSKIYGISQNQL